MAGSASDDGLPTPPGTVTTTWSRVSGPGTVTFGNANALTTTATFSTAGSHTLRLTASDSALATTDDLVVTVNATAVNQPPVVSAGANQTITLPATAALAGSASDDGLPTPPGTVTTTWSRVSGPGTVTFGNANALTTTATFSTAGSHTLRLTASDSALATTDDSRRHGERHCRQPAAGGERRRGIRPLLAGDGGLGGSRPPMMASPLRPAP